MRAQHIWKKYSNYQEALADEVRRYSGKLGEREPVESKPYELWPHKYPVVESELVASIDARLLPFDYTPQRETVFENYGKYRWLKYNIPLGLFRYVWFFAVDDVGGDDLSKKPSGACLLTTPGSVMGVGLTLLKGNFIESNMGLVSGRWKHSYFDFKSLHDILNFQPSDAYLLHLAGGWFAHQMPYSSVDCNFSLYKLIVTGKYINSIDGLSFQDQQKSAQADMDKKLESKETKRTVQPEMPIKKPEPSLQQQVNPWMVAHPQWYQSAPMFPEQYIKQKLDEGLRISTTVFANNMWYAVMSTTFANSPQIFHNCRSPREVIGVFWDKGISITEVAYGHGGWYLVATNQCGFGIQRLLTKPEFPIEEIHEAWKEDYVITSLTYGEGVWVVLMTKGIPYENQELIKGNINDVTKLVNQCYQINKMVVDLAFGNGAWVAVMANNTGYSEETWCIDSQFPETKIKDFWEKGYSLTQLAFGENIWVAVMSKR